MAKPQVPKNDAQKEVVAKRKRSTKKKNLKKLYPVTGPRSAFQLYVSTMAKKHNENSDNTKKFNATQIEPKWKDVRDKSPYEKMERADLLRWLKELHEAHNHEFTPEQQIAYYSELKELGVPCKTPEENKLLIKKKRVPPFFLYSQSKRQDLIDRNGGKITNNEARKLLGEKWKAMTDVEKEPWKKKSDMLFQKA